MASKKISELVACTNPQAIDSFPATANAGSNTEKISVGNLLNNASANVTTNVVTCQTMIVSGNTTPANSTANATQGQIWSDGTYLYIATSTNVIKRVSLDSF